MSKVRIVGLGAALPRKALSNDELAKKIDTSHEWIVTRTGIHQRYVAADGETTATLATQAAARALKASGLSPDDIDLIVVATTTADQVFPSVACLVQRDLGITKGAAFDVQAVCSGFVYAVDVAYRIIGTGGAQRALVIGAETMSRILNWEDRSTAVLFGDGAGAVVLESGHDKGIIDSLVRADGRYAKALQVGGGISAGYQNLRNGCAYMSMNGRQVYRFAVPAMVKTVTELIKRNEKSMDDLKYLVPHQANARMLQQVGLELELDDERIISCVHMHANTSAASIPLALDHAVTQGMIKKDDLIAFCAVGGGFTWGGTLLYF